MCWACFLVKHLESKVRGNLIYIFKCVCVFALSNAFVPFVKQTERMWSCGEEVVGWMFKFEFIWRAPLHTKAIYIGGRVALEVSCGIMVCVWVALKWQIEPTICQLWSNMSLSHQVNHQLCKIPFVPPSTPLLFCCLIIVKLRLRSVFCS